MADACSYDYSTLGSGDLTGFDNELTEAPEEEGDFDILNDETFGDIGDAEFDWEEQTEKFAEVIGSHHRTDLHDDSGFNTAEKNYRTQEEFMERSINQLMVDDDDNDPAVLKSKPIPRKQQNLDSLFGPASPPSFLDAEHLVSPTSKNIWGSPLQDIQQYSQPAQQVNNIQSLFDFAKLANADTPASRGPYSQKASMGLPKAQTLEEIESTLLQKPRVLTAEELERQLRGESPMSVGRPRPGPYSSGVASTGNSSSLPNGHVMAPAHFNVPPPNMGSPQTRPHGMMPGTSPGMMQSVNGHRSPVFGGPGTMGSPMPPGMPVPRGMPVAIGTPPGHGPVPPPHIVGTPPYRSTVSTPHRQSPVLQQLNRRSPLLRTPSPPPHIPQASTARIVPPHLCTPYPTPSALANRYIATPGRGYSQPIGIPQSMRGPPPPVGSPYDSAHPPHGVMGSPQGPYQSPQQHQHRMQHPGSFNESNNNIRHVNGSNKFQPSHGMAKSQGYTQRGGGADRRGTQEHREHRYYRYPYNQKHESRGEHAPGARPKRGSRDSDPYDGLMTQKEKDWIIKIQLLQLQTDNPYLDDYYYASWCMKKAAKEREKDGEKIDSKLVIPALARVENKTYKPAHFEGSLGRLTTSSVHNPRQIIDLLAKSMSESAASGQKGMPTHVGKELRKSRQLLMDIEKGYNLILVIDDLEKKILALPEETRKPLLEERSYHIDLLFHYLLCDGNSAAFMQYMNVRKGRTLTKRALPYLDKVQAVGIVSLVCKNLQQLMKRDQAEERVEELYGPCALVIDSCNLATVVMFAEDIQQEDTPSSSKPIALALQNKFGSSILCALLHRGEEIYSTTSPVDMDSNLQNEWCEFVHDFAGILATLPVECVAEPLETHEDVAKHAERLLNKRLAAVVEDNLAVFTHGSRGGNEA